MCQRFPGAVAAVLLLILPALAAAANPPVNDVDRRTPVVIAVEKTAPAVVNLSTTKLVRQIDPWFGRYGRPRKVQSVGSGVIIHPDGYVVTNSHVVRQATKIVVGLGENGSEKDYDGVLLAEDPKNDLALVKIHGDRPFPFAVLGRSDDLMIGEPAIAVGNPFSVGKTVTTGVVSALQRTVHVDEGVFFEDFIQTDAAINPGNSGGALLNIHGEMIGVNTAIIRGGEGIGFAIPVDRVKAILGRLIEAAVDRSNLGFEPVPGPGGVRVGALVADGAARRGGLVEGDVIERVEDRSVETVFDFATPILEKRPGDRILITVRRDGERRRVDLIVPEPPLSSAQQYVASRLGVVPRAPDADELARGVTGVVVDDVLEEGPAARVQMQRGDVLVAIAGYRFEDVAGLASLLQRARSGAALDVEVIRGGRAMTGSLTIR